MKSLLVFASLALLVGCGPDVGTEGPATDDEATKVSRLTTHFRVVAGNLTSGSPTTYDSGHGARIFDALDADLVLIQEFNARDVAAFVSTTFGPNYSYVRGKASESIPNGVISRYPIIKSDTWADGRVNGTRGFTWALIDVPGDKDVFAVSLHLSTTKASTRRSEAAALVSLLSQNVPTGSIVILGGDLNTNSRSEGTLATLSQVVDTTGPYPADQRGNTNTNSGRDRPYDWVLVSHELTRQATPSVVGGITFANGLVADTRVFNPISGLAPARANDSSASGMQHMAVVRDFLLDSDIPTPTGKVIINEVLANEPGTDSSQEFVELFNAGEADADLSGWTLSDSAQVRHVFKTGTTLAAKTALVLKASEASTGALGLSNSSDSVRLSSSGTVVDEMSWTASLSVDGISINRAVDGDSSKEFVLHNTLSSLNSSAGTQVDGSAF